VLILLPVAATTGAFATVDTAATTAACLLLQPLLLPAHHANYYNNNSNSNNDCSCESSYYLLHTENDITTIFWRVLGDPTACVVSEAAGARAGCTPVAGPSTC